MCKVNILTISGWNEIYSELIARGFENEINWQRNLKPCSNMWDFASEAIWVILNSGMKEQIARIIQQRIYAAHDDGKDISEVFKHKGKVAAIKYVMDKHADLWKQYESSDDKIQFLKSIPFIGNITCYHLAKNLGYDVVKPDRHLVRVAKVYGLTPDELCIKISKMTGEKVSTVDIIIWRACNQQLL